MSFIERIKSLFFKKTYEETIASFVDELDNGQKQLFHEYEEKRGTLNFTGATAALQSLIVQDTNEKHREFYRILIEEMRIYLSQPETGARKIGPGEEKLSDVRSPEPDMQFTEGTIRYTFRGKGKIGYRRKDDK